MRLSLVSAMMLSNASTLFRPTGATMPNSRPQPQAIAFGDVLLVAVLQMPQRKPT
jgi:hypothetical protein